MCPSPQDARPKTSRCPFSSLLSLPSSEAPQTCPWRSQAQLQPTTSCFDLGSDSSCSTLADLQHDKEASSCNDLQQLDTTSTSTSSSASDSSESGTYVHQAWQLKRPILHHDPKLTRRQLRKLGRTWSLSDVAQHKFCDDGWIAVDGKVYDLTEHIATHPGWDSGCRVTEVLSIIAHLGVDCSEEFHEIHRAYPVAYKQLAAYYIGDLQ